MLDKLYNKVYNIGVKEKRCEMNKSVYSVLLSDELVDKLDEVAYKKGVSRSVMLDRLLAEYLTVETAEMKMNNVFTEIGRLIERCAGLRFIDQPSGYMASVQSALAYKYNPTVKYSIELFPAGDLGQLKISLRSKNVELMQLMERFYDFFISLERKYIGERAYGYDGGRFVRVMLRPEVSNEKTGKAIAEYVSDFDKYLRIFFSGLDDRRKAAREIEKVYADNIRKKEVIL